MDEDGKTIILKIQWIDTGKIEENKEVNISASIWKFQKSRGMIDSPREHEPLQAITLHDIMERIEGIHDFQHEIIEFQVENRKDREVYDEHMLKIHDTTLEQLGLLYDISKQIQEATAKLEDLHKGYDLTSKLIDKI